MAGSTADSELGFRRELDVFLYGHHIGGIHRRGSSIAFAFEDQYKEDPKRSVLGLAFEENINTVHYSDRRVPPWFENLLPEGILARALEAAGDGDRYEREISIFEVAGQDLAGAVQVVRADESPAPRRVSGLESPPISNEEIEIDEGSLRFSVAGIGLKFSMRRANERFSLPARNEQGQWLVKMPDPTFPALPRNEYATMRLAAEVGIEVPKIALISREQVSGVKSSLWRGEDEAFAIERFDRTPVGDAVHIEDLAQVRGIFSKKKYEGNYETVGNIIFRGHDEASLKEYARRLAFNLMIGNADGHLKNWSLIYRDRRRPAISPAYDLVSVLGYRDFDVNTRLALRLSNRKSFDVSLDSFVRLGRKVGTTSDLRSVAAETAEDVIRSWDVFADTLSNEPDILAASRDHVATMAKRLLGLIWTH